MRKYWYHVGYTAQFTTPNGGTYMEYGDEFLSVDVLLSYKQDVDLLRVALVKAHNVPKGQGIVTMGSPVIVITGIFHLPSEV